MLFYKVITKECWFHTNEYCRYENKCINEHKIRCLEKVLTGQCNKKKNAQKVTYSVQEYRKGKAGKGPVTELTQANVCTYIQSTTTDTIGDTKTMEVGTIEV